VSTLSSTTAVLLLDSSRLMSPTLAADFAIRSLEVNTYFIAVRPRIVPRTQAQVVKDIPAA